MTEQTTIAASSGWIAGSALDRPGECRLRFHPAGADEGIRFARSDLPGAPEVRCEPGNLRSMPRWTSLEQAGVVVHHTEHVLAALAFCGVDNVKIKFENKRLALGFDLSNVTPQTGLVGKVEVFLVGNDATLTPLKPEKDELSFQIQRFKQIAAGLPLPARIEPRDVYGVRLVIVDPSGKPIFALSAITRKSQARQTSRPPPSA